MQEAGFQLLRGQRPGQQESLHLIAAMRPQPFQLAAALDAFGRDGDAEILAEGEDGAGDGGIREERSTLPTNALSILMRSGGKRVM